MLLKEEQALQPKAACLRAGLGCAARLSIGGAERRQYARRTRSGWVVHRGTLGATGSAQHPVRTCAAEPICSCSSACRALRSATTDRSFFRLRGCFSPAAFSRSAGSGRLATAGVAAAGFLALKPLVPLKPPLGGRMASGAVCGSANAAADVCTPRRWGEVSRR